MKKLITTLLILGTVIGVNAQISTNKYWVQFTDKAQSPYSIERPEEFLTERSIQRRQNQGIAIDEYDIPVNQAYLDAVANCGATLLNPSKWLNGVTIETSSSSVIAAINALTFVEAVRGCYNDPVKQAIKEKTFFSNETYSPINPDKNVLLDDEYYGYAYPQINQLNGIALHEAGYQGEGMFIGVCDGGFDGADFHHVFDSIREDGRLLGTKDFVHKGGSVYNESSHGTSCWSLIGGNIPGTYVGTAPKAMFYLCRTEDVNSENLIEEYNWVSGAEHLDSLGVDVINTSLGYITFDMTQLDHTYQDMDGQTCVITIGAEVACSRGILCVNSAGNEGGSYSYPYMGAPADGEHVFSIGAVGTDGQRAYFSSVGPSYDGRIKPDVMAHGYDTYVAASYGDYYSGSGTSFASPVMAGMVTCLWQSHPEATAEVIKQSLRANGNYASNPNNEYGYGIPNFVNAIEYLGVEESFSAENTLINVYPNPSNGMVQVTLKNEGMSSIQVFDQVGRMVYMNDLQQDNTSDLQSFLSGLHDGLYLINVMNEGSVSTMKLIKY